jgi:hypothetical protein
MKKKIYSSIFILVFLAFGGFTLFSFSPKIVGVEKMFINFFSPSKGDNSIIKIENNSCPLSDSEDGKYYCSRGENNDVQFINDGILGRSVLIDNSDVYPVDLSDKSLDKVGSMVIWIKLKDCDVVASRYILDLISSRREYDKNRISLLIDKDKTLLFIVRNNDGESNFIRLNVNLEDLLIWNQLAVSWNESTSDISVFRNGELVKKQSATIKLDRNLDQVYVGSDFYGKNQINGQLDELSVLSEVILAGSLFTEYNNYSNPGSFAIPGKPFDVK